MINIQKYRTHYNGSRPFNVEIINSRFDKYIVKVEANDKTKYSNTFYASECFIGKSHLCKMTEFSGGHGDSFDGNSILIKIGEFQYIFICNKIYKFYTMFPIISYLSPIGNNDLPYPYAILSNGDICLLLENVILKNSSKMQEYMLNVSDDPYKYYYLNSKISNYKNINKFTIGGESYNLTYSSTPISDYERFLKFKPNADVSIHVYIENILVKIVLTKDEYVELIEDYGNFAGFEKLNSSVLHT